MENQNFDIIAAIHRLYIDGVRKKGGADKILEYFSNKGKKILLIEHPLCGLREKGLNMDNFVIVSEMVSGEIKEIERKEIIRRGNWIRWISEFIFNVKLIRSKTKEKVIFFSADPLNNLAGLFCFGKIKFKYYHCVDYSRDRFGDLKLNIIYQIAVILSLRFFDLISVVSSKTKNEFIKLRAEQNKVFLLPNSPDFKRIKIPKHKENILIYTSNSIIERYNYQFVVKLVRNLKKEFPNIKLFALGGKNTDKAYFNKIKKTIKNYKIEKNIIFKGFVDNKELAALLLKSKIGLSFYSGIVSYYMIFGDSLKIREYALWGLPIISDGNSSTDIEMAQKGCGFIVNNLNETRDKIRTLLLNDKLYNKYRQNSLNWARKMDKKKLLIEIYKKIFLNEK